MGTLKITLNSSWLRLHKSIATPVNFLFKSKHEREQHRYEECLFLTQSGNNLIYTTLTGRYAVQQWEAVDFDLPWPITINTATVPYKINSNRACLEIPSCTGSALETFYDTNRPAFIKDSDLQTKVIAIDGRRANIEFIKPYGRLDKLNQIIKTVEENPFTDSNQYQWFTRDNGGKIDYCEISKIYKTVLGQDVFEYEYLRYPGDTIIMQRINELHKDILIPLAKELNVDFVWVHGANTVLESTFAHSLNSREIPTLVVEMGVGMRITKDYCEQLVDGIFHLMKKMGIWTGETAIPRVPIVSENPEDVSYINAPQAGVFVPHVRHWEHLKKGEEIGWIIDPLCGKILEKILSPVDGILFTIREYPIVDNGSLIGRLLRKEAWNK